MKAHLLVKQHIDTLLRVRHQDRKDLAQWCYKSESWISKIFKEPRRSFALRDLDRIADFFGIATYQLFQPGISSLTERRSGLDRRSKTDRRIGTSQRVMLRTAEALEPHRPQRKGSHVVVAASSPLMEALTLAAASYAKQVDAIMARYAESGGQAPAPRDKKPPARPRRRTAGGSDAPTD